MVEEDYGQNNKYYTVILNQAYMCPTRIESYYTRNASGQVPVYKVIFYRMTEIDPCKSIVERSSD